MHHSLISFEYQTGFQVLSEIHNEDEKKMPDKNQISLWSFKLHSCDSKNKKPNYFPFYQITFQQGMSCEGACAHAHVRCAVARVRVRAKSILRSVRDVRACGSFWACDVRPYFCTLLERPIPL